MIIRSLSTAFLVAAVAIATLSEQAAAQPTTPLEKSMDAVPGPALGQKYDGVVPGPAGKNPLPLAPKSGPHLVWTGFQMTETGSRVFLQTTQIVEFELKENPAKKSGKSILSITLRGCRIHMANNRRKIDTRYFATPVSNVSAKQKGRNVEVHIALRELASAVPHSETGPEGSQFVVLDFPPGKATPEPSPLQNLADEAQGRDATQTQGANDDGSSSPRTGRKASK